MKKLWQKLTCKHKWLQATEWLRDEYLSDGVRYKVEWHCSNCGKTTETHTIVPYSK